VPVCSLGKTLMSLSLLAYLKQYRGYAGPHLIIVPKSTSSNWLREVKRWTNNLSVHRFHGNQEERDLAKPLVSQHDITITTYEMVRVLRRAPCSCRSRAAAIAAAVSSDAAAHCVLLLYAVSVLR
jgi:hypothetical protein